MSSPAAQTPIRVRCGFSVPGPEGDNEDAFAVHWIGDDRLAVVVVDGVPGGGVAASTGIVEAAAHELCAGSSSAAALRAGHAEAARRAVAAAAVVALFRGDRVEVARAGDCVGLVRPNHGGIESLTPAVRPGRRGFLGMDDFLPEASERVVGRGDLFVFHSDGVPTSLEQHIATPPYTSNRFPDTGFHYADDATVVIVEAPARRRVPWNRRKR